MADMTEIGADLNETIAAAVNARITAEVVGALSGDETMRAYIIAALNEPLEFERNYRRIKTTFMKHTLNKAIQEAVKDAVNEVIAAEQEEIKKAVVVELRKEREHIAEQLVDSLAKRAESAYGMHIELKFPNQD